jgi:hypothetical protein
MAFTSFACAAMVRTGGRPSISGGKKKVCPHFQQRLTAPIKSSLHLGQVTGI